MHQAVLYRIKIARADDVASMFATQLATKLLPAPPDARGDDNLGSILAEMRDCRFASRSPVTYFPRRQSARQSHG